MRKLRTTATFKFDYVSVAFVQSELKKIKKNKAAGLDELPGVLLKDSASVISKPLSYLLNLSLKTSQVPRDWKIAKLTPIFKSGIPLTLTVIDRLVCYVSYPKFSKELCTGKS